MLDFLKSDTFPVVTMGLVAVLLIIITVVIIVPAAPTGTPLGTLKARFVEANGVPAHAGILRTYEQETVYEMGWVERCGYPGYDADDRPTGPWACTTTYEILQDCIYYSGGDNGGAETICTPRVLEWGGTRYRCDPGYRLGSYHFNVGNSNNAFYYQCNSN